MISEVQIEGLEVANGKRLAWPLRHLSEATGTSVAYWKKAISKGEIAVTKIGALNAILDEDVREYLMRNRRVRGKAASIG